MNHYSPSAQADILVVDDSPDELRYQKSSVSEYVTLSLEVATNLLVADLPLKSLRTAADQALYCAKKQGEIVCLLLKSGKIN